MFIKYQEMKHVAHQLVFTYAITVTKVDRDKNRCITAKIKMISDMFPKQVTYTLGAASIFTHPCVFFLTGQHCTYFPVTSDAPILRKKEKMSFLFLRVASVYQHTPT